MVEYRSAIRVYDVDEDGQPFSLRYAIGDPIPLGEARRQGLVTGVQPEPDPEPGPDPGEAKAVPAPPQDKVRKPRATKTRTPDAPEEG